MQWSCPHCGVVLAVADNVLGTGWSFSRCYKCGGFALIRRAEVNIIKVDKAPPGEKIILPEASNDPTVNLLSNEATQKAAKYFTKEFDLDSPRGPGASAGVVSSAHHALPPTPPYQRAPVNSAHAPSVAAIVNLNQSEPQGPLLQNFEKESVGIDISNSSLPDPLPEVEKKGVRSYVIPVGISAAAILMVVSGSFLYIQGQALWTKAREASRNASRGASNEASRDDSAESQTPSIAQNSAQNPVTRSPAVLPAPSLLHAESAAQEKPLTVAAATARSFPKSEIIDQVQKSAMAPEREKFNDSLKEVLKTAVPLPDKVDSGFVVRVRPQRANLRSGPGLNFPVIGTAIPTGKYQVMDLNNGWFKLIVQNTAGTPHNGQINGQMNGQINGWIRNELVQVMPK